MRTRIQGCSAIALGLSVFACSGTEPTEPTRPAAITVVLGDKQLGRVGQSLGLPFMVRVTDTRGVGVGNIPVTWSVTSGDGILNGLFEQCGLGLGVGNPLPSTSVSTDADGFAWVSFMPAWFGPTTVSAEVEGLDRSRVIFTTDATDPRATLAISFQDSQEATASWFSIGSLRIKQFGVVVTDGRGNAVPHVALTWEITAGGGKFVGRDHFCSRIDTNPATMIARTAGTFGNAGAILELRPTVFGVTTVTAAVPGMKGSPVTLTFDAKVLEIGVIHLSDSTFFRDPNFSPDAIVPVGATVEWWNYPHTTRTASARITSTAVPPGGASFDSGNLSEDGRFRFVPGVAGTWKYVDQVSGAMGTLTAR